LKQVAQFTLLIIVIISLSTSCRKDSFTLNGNIAVNTDTLWFDTVFTKVTTRLPQSVNKQILVHNTNNETIRTSIKLAGGINSHFRLNVDGEPGTNFTDIEILPNDSIFLFVEVHPSANNNSPDFNPLIIRDSILFNTSGKESKTMLIGWGQDAHYIFRDSIDTDTTWANDKLPIVVYGFFYVKPGAKLTIQKNMKVHFAPASWLFVEGQLDMKGTKDEPIVMQGDRLQPDWEETPGQWGGVWLSHPTYGNTIEHSLIKNGIVGVYCDSSSGMAGQPNVTIKKTMIRNMSVDGVSGKGSTINMENSISVNCGRYSFLAQQGGVYSIKHCTFYTGSGFSRQDPTFVYVNVRRQEISGAILETYPIQYQFLNNIIYGTQPDGEIFGDIDFSKVANPSFVNYNLIKTDIPFYNTAGFNNTINKLPKFKNIPEYDFDLDSLSPAQNAGVLLSPLITDDYCNRPRLGVPDCGAFEFQN
jgi:hypothetical protein